MYITITAGHSNTDPGAVNGSDREADIAQDMRNIVASILRTAPQTFAVSRGASSSMKRRSTSSSESCSKRQWHY